MHDVVCWICVRKIGQRVRIREPMSYDVKSRILREARLKRSGRILRCSEVVIARCRGNVAKLLLITGGCGMIYIAAYLAAISASRGVTRASRPLNKLKLKLPY